MLNILLLMGLFCNLGGSYKVVRITQYDDYDYYDTDRLRSITPQDEVRTHKLEFS